ncbi:MAG: hypothetical protein M5R36_28985 [Deltaproteobacteria bacterium]|nr:hypothetical protein [Deltaproteobacteria bacterium]
MSSRSSYDYNADCWEDDAYLEKCPADKIDTGDVFIGKPLTQSDPAAPSGYECRQFSVVFDEFLPLPERFWAWPEYRYTYEDSESGEVYHPSVTGEFMKPATDEGTPDWDETTLESCIRPKDTSVLDEGLNALMAGEIAVPADPEPDDSLAGTIFEVFDDEMLVEGATVEALDNWTGLSFDPPVSAVSDEYGDYELDEIPEESGGVIGLKITKEGYAPLY